VGGDCHFTACSWWFWLIWCHWCMHIRPHLAFAVSESMYFTGFFNCVVFLFRNILKNYF
jgi:hypothetical protein